MTFLHLGVFLACHYYFVCDTSAFSISSVFDSENKTKQKNETQTEVKFNVIDDSQHACDFNNSGNTNEIMRRKKNEKKSNIWLYVNYTRMKNWAEIVFDKAMRMKKTQSPSNIDSQLL